MQTSALATTDTASRALATKGATALDLIDVMEDLLKVGRFFVESGMMPPGVNTASKAALIIWKGHELGIKPLQAVTGINVIQGRPSIAPQLMLNKIIQSKEAEFFKFVESTNERCTIHAKRKNGLEIIETFSMEDAGRIMSKEDNKVIPLSQKSNYRNQPKIMLRWRCVSAVGRIIFPDVIEGCHTPDELEDEQVPFDEIIPEPAAEASSQTETGTVVDAVYETSQGSQAQETGNVQTTTEPAAKQEAAAPAADSSTAPVKLVSPAQAKALVKAIKENGINEAEFLKKHDIAAVESLPASLFQETLKTFNASKETNAQAAQQEASKAAEEKKSSTITAEQLKELQSIIDKLGPGYDTSKLFAHFKIKTLNELPADNYNFVHETLAKKLAA